MSTALVLVGVGAALVFVAVLFAEGVSRHGYDPLYHTGSELTLGERGWIQRTNFLQLGVGMFAFAVGVHGTLNNLVAAVLLAIFGFGSIVAGVFPPDPVHGYPAGPQRTPVELTWQHKVHHAAGPLMFIAIFAACLLLAGRLAAPWQLYTVLTAVAGLALTVWTALAFQRDAAHTGLVQRGLIVVYFTWIVLLGIHIATSPAQG